MAYWAQIRRNWNLTKCQNRHFTMSCVSPTSGACVAVLLGRVNDLPVHLRDSVREMLMTAEFRSARSFVEQIDILHKDGILPYSVLSLLYEIPCSSLYKLYKAEKLAEMPCEREEEPVKVFAGNHSTLTNEEEDAVIQWIVEAQRRFDCASIQDVLEYASNLLRKRDPRAEKLARPWWRSFKRRHKDEIEVKTIDSREFARTTVTAEQVHDYYARVLQALTQLRTPKQLVNMDETGFASRIDKGRKKKCVCSKVIPTPPRFQEEKQVSQLSVAVSLNLLGELLRPMFITKEEIRMNNGPIRTVAQHSVFTRSSKGYQTANTMIDWIRNVWEPYCKTVRTEMGNPEAPMFLILDNCPSHNTPPVLEMFRQLKTELIWLPPHSSHFLQQLDVNFFSVLKTYYKSGTEKTTPKVAGKVTRAFMALWRASCPITVMKCWEMTGFRYVYSGMQVTRISLDFTTITKLIYANCQMPVISDDEEIWIEE